MSSVEQTDFTTWFRQHLKDICLFICFGSFVLIYCFSKCGIWPL